MRTLWPLLVEALKLDLLAYLGLAVLLGGAIGLERERRGKAAGLRTNILICVGAALFTRLSIGIGGDPGRIAAQIVTGVGFLGAGTILHAKGRVTGLTSAATIWLVAAIGVAVGAGRVYEAAGATLLVLVVLALLVHFEKYVRSLGTVSRVSMEVDADPERVTEIEGIVRRAGLEILEIHSEMSGNKRLVTLDMAGPSHLHDQVKLQLLRKSGAFTVSVDE